MTRRYVLLLHLSPFAPSVRLSSHSLPPCSRFTSFFLLSSSPPSPPQVRAVNAYSKTSLREEHTLFFEFHGTPQSVKEQSEAVEALARDNGGRAFEWSTSPEERAKLWHARHTAYWAAIAAHPGRKGFPTDVCVPISTLAECLMETMADRDRLGISAPLVGHVGDGNFHMLIMMDPQRADEVKRAR
jgi:D-lactate dehydrogenase (cytochrome)